MSASTEGELLDELARALREEQARFDEHAHAQAASVAAFRLLSDARDRVTRARQAIDRAMAKRVLP